MYSQACFIAMNSEPKELVSIVVCFLEVQYIGALLTKIINPVRERLLVVSPVWSESTKAHNVTAAPLDSGMLGGSSSVLDPYTVADQSSLEKAESSMVGSEGSNTMTPLCLCLRKANIRNN